MKKTFSFLLAAAYFCGFAQENQVLSKLKNETGAVVTINKSTASPSFIRFNQGKTLQLKGTDAKAKAQQFLTENYKAFNLRSADEMVLAKENVDNYGMKNVVYQQYFQGVPVYDGGLKFHFNAKNELTSINGNVIPNIKTSATPLISKSEAESLAKNIIDQQKLNKNNLPLEIAKNHLLIFPKGLAQRSAVSSYLAYEVEITNKNDVREFLYINALTGELVEQFTGIDNVIDRELYEVSTYPSNRVWKEGDEFPGELNIWQQNEIVTAGQVYNFFKNAFGHVSYDNNDHKMVTINNNPQIKCPNANWNGLTVNYCDGTAADDVVAHEWGHAYTEYTSGLIYQYQAGALNESYSDVWGETIDIINNYQDEDEDLSVRTTAACNSGSLRWKMGEDAVAFGAPIRDMWNPNCNGNPGSALDSNYYCGDYDSGGVHLNSGVTNHTYALLVDGGTYNGYTINGIGFVKAAHLWWRAQTTYLNATSDFADFADALEASCNDLIGINLEGLSTSETPAGLSGQSFTEADIQNVKNAILATELRESVAEQCGYEPLLNETSDLCEAATTSPIFSENWENGIGDWTVAEEPVKPSTWESRPWTIKDNLPKGRTGHAIFAADPINGDCVTDMQNGVIQLQSPSITIPDFADGKVEMAFNHYVATEAGYDGGNIKYSLNNGEWTILPKSAFTQNGYNITLEYSTNDSPLKGQVAFSGTDGGSLSGSWGQSIIDLSKIGVTAGSTIQFRFDMGSDGCNGTDSGWYIDEIYVYNCSLLSVENIQKNNGVKVFPNPTSGIITVENTKNQNLKNAEIYNVAGQLVKSFPLNKSSKNTTLDLGNLTKGTYILKINSDNESSSVKIIKK